MFLADSEEEEEEEEEGPFQKWQKLQRGAVEHGDADGDGEEWAAAATAALRRLREPELFGGQLRFQSGAVNNNNKK